MLTTASAPAITRILDTTTGFLEAALEFVVIDTPHTEIRDHTGVQLPASLHREALEYITPFLYSRPLAELTSPEISYKQVGRDLYMAASQLDDAFTQPQLIDHQAQLTRAAVTHGPRYLRLQSDGPAPAYKLDDDPIDYS